MIGVIHIFGCGNTLFGDDGFGPAVVRKLQKDFQFSADVVVEDVGTGLREYLIDYLLLKEGRPEKIIVIDAVDFPDRTPGEVFPVLPHQIPVKKVHDFSLHQFPTVNLLAELSEFTSINVLVLAGQVNMIPNEVCPGLSRVMEEAVIKSCEMIFQIVSER